MKGGIIIGRNVDAMKQFGLKGMLEFAAACGFLFTISSTVDFVAYAIACAVVAVWSLRIRNWAIRYCIFNWLVACSSIWVGLACLEQALITSQADYNPTELWLLFGCAAMVWAPLAGVIGFVFFAEWWGRDETLERTQR